MAFLNSEDISVFPSTRRGVYQPTARSIHESTVVNIINKLIDKDGFVITESDPVSGLTLTDPLEFNIHGYNFIAKEAQDLIIAVGGAPTKIIAAIKLDGEGVSYDPQTDYIELDGQDDNNLYKGLYLTDNEEDPNLSTYPYRVTLMEKDLTTNNWFVSYKSNIRFSSGVIELTVDGGII